MSRFEDKLIEVCDNCECASCWYGEFMCDYADSAGTVLKTVRQLIELDYEHEDYWSSETMTLVYGDPCPHGYK